MTNLIKWGNGDTILGSVEREKDFLSGTFHQQTGGVRIEWSPADVEILAGKTWRISSGSTAAPYKRYQIIYDYKENNTTYPNNAASIYGYSPPTAIASTLCGNRHFWWASMLGDRAGLACGDFYSPALSLPQSLSDRNISYRQTFSGSNWTGRTYTLTLKSVSEKETVYNSPGKPTKTVTTDTAQSSTRETSVNPNVSLLSGDCLLTINYADNSTEQISIPGTCPTWVDCECIYPGACTILDRMISNYGV